VTSVSSSGGVPEPADAPAAASASPADRAAAIFLALSRVPQAEHARLLDERCGGDANVRHEVERLLAALDLSISLPGAAAMRPSSRETDFTPRPGARVGDFIVSRQIGSGATGVVYLAHQQHPARVVALKVLRREYVASVVQRRFEIEAELLGQLHHPGIAQVYAAHPGDANTPPYIAMELVEGPSLIDYAGIQRLNARQRVELMALVCDAVQHAHQRGIIHRDLKPGNILVTADGQPKVLDFGVARAVGTQVLMSTVETEAGQLLGTLAYMSPEQVAAAPDAIDTRTDIHALGVILFRLLIGHLPFGHDDPPLPELARRILSDDAPRLGAIDPAFRGDLEVIVARALAKEKDRRYASAASLANDLRRYLAGQPISASADSTWYTLRRRIRRYRAALALFALVTIALGGMAWYANVQRAQAQQLLVLSNLERARLVSMTGNLPIAEELAWRELFRAPDSPHAQWTLWEIYSREPTLWTVMPHEGGTFIARFSPDERLMLTAGQLDGIIRIFDVASGRVVRSLEATPKAGTRRAYFTPDSASIVAGGRDGTLRVWDVRTGALRREIPKVVPALEDFAMAGSGTYGVIVTPQGGLQVWSLTTGQLEADLSTQAPDVLGVAADPAGTLLLAAARGGVITAFDIAKRERLWQTQPHQGDALSVALSPDGHTVASGGIDALLQLLDRETGRLRRTIPTENGTVRNIVFDRRGTKVAAAGHWRTKLWDLSDPSSPPRDLGGGEGTTDLDLHPGARLLATSRAPDHVRVWDLAADPRTDHWVAHDRAVTGLAVGAEGHAIFSAGADGRLSLWRPRAGGQERQTAPSASMPLNGRAGQIAISKNERWIVTVGQAGTAAVWDARDGNRLATFPEAGPASGTSRAVTFMDNDRQIVIGDFDGSLTIWDWTGGVPQRPRLIDAPSLPNEVLAITSHGSRFIVAHREQVVVIRDVATAREIRRLRPAASPFSLAVTPDGRHLVVGTWLGFFELWDIDTGRLLETVKGPTGLATAVDISTDGRLLALSSRDGSTRLWDITTRQWLATVATRRAGAERVRFFPDNRRLAIGYADGEVEIRDLQYFFRYAAGQAAYRLQLLKAAGESPSRADEVIAWSQRFLSGSR
jgi:eukaryotic-like serine/threonine-protein kinase